MTLAYHRAPHFICKVGDRVVLTNVVFEQFRGKRGVITQVPGSLMPGHWNMKYDFDVKLDDTTSAHHTGEYGGWWGMVRPERLSSASPLLPCHCGATCDYAAEGEACYGPVAPVLLEEGGSWKHACAGHADVCDGGAYMRPTGGGFEP